ncbi:unnamed protein product [marine sediment metagenome]|uniref:Uncharacterized protein n=1 Tax=marine sediment metagenome TaxID=412755 RepID=X1M2D5_9ZZZZ
MLVNDIDEIVKQNHYGARCWLNSKDVCQEICCTECQVFLDAVSNAVKKVTVVENCRVPEAIKISF